MKSAARLRRSLVCSLVAATLCAPALFAQAAGQPTPQAWSGMRWREIGPMRAGRTNAVSGVAAQPNVFYIGAVNGGVWKTTDSGETWQPLFNDQPTGSIGAIAVAPSDPNIVYVGSGEGLARPDLSTGDGVYKSTDAGRTWQHLGLRDTQQIGRLAVDPHNPDRLFVAAIGHPYGPNTQRGLYRSLDGGKTFQRVLYVDPDTGASDVQIDPSHPNIVFAGMWERREGPWENGAWGGTNGGLYRSTDGGSTWTKLTGHGLPDGIVQVDTSISPTDSNRIYATIAHGARGREVGFFRSDDGGRNWVHTTTDVRPEERIGGGDLPVPIVDPKNPDVIYSCSIVLWKSTDAGKTWTALRGSPGGDDYQNMWINPTNPNILALTSDQGAIVSVNGGRTWGQWFNQPTAQMYHVSTDDAFPYRVCGGQQDSGSACVASRGNDGRITFHDWHPAGIEEYGQAAPDPLDPDIVYGGKVTRYDRRTGQIANVEPKPLRDYRVLRTEPLEFSPLDPHRLFFAANTIWSTRDGGHSWTQVSPDLTRKIWVTPPTVGVFKSEHSAQPSDRGVVYALALSPLNAGRMWAGTDDGYLWTTADGGNHWTNVTPPQLQPWWKVFNMDAGHFDPLTAYAAINTMRLDDMRPHLFRTHDGGKSWTEIDNGIPDGAATNTIREDPKRKGLLFAGTETQVYVSFDDGDHWQSLRLNMPASSVRDLQIKGDDLVAGTHGRGYLILDDITPLRQVTAQVASSPAFLYRPQTALRIRGDMNPPTPWPPEMATGTNPPDGAILDYYLGPNIQGPVTLEILDSTGRLVRRYSSADPAPPIDPHYPVPLLWNRPPQLLSAAPGEHRFLWDVHEAPVPGLVTDPDFDQAVPHNTPPVPTAPWVLPGRYTVRLTANGTTLTQPLQVVMDPRVKTPPAALQQQYDLSMQLYRSVLTASDALHRIASLRQQIQEREISGAKLPALDALNTKLTALAGGTIDPYNPPHDAKLNLTAARDKVFEMQHSIQNADLAPTTQQVAASHTALQAVTPLLAQWNTLQTQDLAPVNAELKQHGLQPLDPQATMNTKDLDVVESGDKDADAQ